tara:strand:+ start:1893 stop:2105 length:213 start_codon:yes stop_codon:yes gene_type:complete
MTYEESKMDEETYPISHNAPAPKPRKSDLIREVAIVLREDGHAYIAEIETNYEPNLVDAMDKIWTGELVL